MDSFRPAETSLKSIVQGNYGGLVVTEINFCVQLQVTAVGLLWSPNQLFTGEEWDDGVPFDLQKAYVGHHEISMDKKPYGIEGLIRRIGLARTKCWRDPTHVLFYKGVPCT